MQKQKRGMNMKTKTTALDLRNEMIEVIE